MNILLKLSHWRNRFQHMWREIPNETLGPKNVDPNNPGKMKYPLIRECYICGQREIWRDTQWTKKTCSYGGGEIIEKTPSEWIRLLKPNEKIVDYRHF